MSVPLRQFAMISRGPPSWVATRGKSGGGGLQECQPEGLGECGVHKDALPLGSPAVEACDLRRLVGLRIGRGSVEIPVIDGSEEFHPHLARPGRELVDPLPVAADEDQVRVLAQPLVSGKCTDEAGKVFPLIGACDGQDGRLRRVAEKRRELRVDRRRHLR